ncbi:acetyl-CoA acetyltransferase [Mycobacterium sp. NAZ190054]|uniref:acetyl-CoA acetyltransferase n=1 Tax=Mycobacterium sp. NAZ190054 TaxID=1747766 RepID=UPI00079AB6F5|nr:acetyl-CoA acetyltransferase [Mycobacterium sp. NAZ190054]KWX69275.1 hypothetical protein ASJ79_00305 [Mycobacterium sp. NAZ190054]
MTVDGRTPVIIGCGETVLRPGTWNGVHPVGLMADAVRAATADASLSSVPQPDAVAVVALLSWRYDDPAYLLATELGVQPRATFRTAHGGNAPQSLINEFSARIQSGQLDLAILAGGEMWRTARRARREGVDLGWPQPDGSSSPHFFGPELDMSHPDEKARGITRPVQVYPLFETAIRATNGRTVEEQQIVSSELWSRFSAVAAANPNAWLPKYVVAEEIRTPTASNRYIGFPYTKLMNSNNDVDMAAAVIVCSVARARALGVPTDRWIFPQAGSDAHEHNFVSDRWDFSAAPAIQAAGRQAMELSGIGHAEEIDIIDLYSCFPSVVQLGAKALGIGLDRQLTRTGGLTFAGGPWNNYVMHALAATVRDLRNAHDAATALVWANGGFATKHSFGAYAKRPPDHGFRRASPQDDIDKLPSRRLASAADAAGTHQIETYTVMHDRRGKPEKAIVTCLLADGRRAWAISAEPTLAAELTMGEWVGAKAVLDASGELQEASR